MDEREELSTHFRKKIASGFHKQISAKPEYSLKPSF